MISRDPLAKRFHIFPYNVESKHIPKDLLQKLQEGGDSAELGGQGRPTSAFSLAVAFHLWLGRSLLLGDEVLASVSAWKALESSVLA